MAWLLRKLGAQIHPFSLLSFWIRTATRGRLENYCEVEFSQSPQGLKDPRLGQWQVSPLAVKMVTLKKKNHQVFVAIYHLKNRYSVNRF